MAQNEGWGDKAVPTNVPISDGYRAPLWMAVAISTVITVISALLLDGGQAARLSGFGLLVFWSWVAAAICLRPRDPTLIDLLLIRWGCLPLVLGFQIAVHVAWQLRGLE